MSTIVTRSGKGSPLTHVEMDANFTNLNTDKYQEGSAIGTVTPAAGAFTTLSASSTVSGTGFSTYLASPPAIGGTTASTGRFTTVTSTVATGTAPFTVASTTPVANLSIGGNAGTVTNGVYTTDTGTVTNTMLAGSIANAKLTNSSITFGSTAQALGSMVSAISGVTIDNGAIGGTAAAAGTFTTLTGTTSTTTPIVQNSAAAAISFKTNSATSAVTQFNISHTASAVNYLQVTGSATGSNPSITAIGSDGNLGLSFVTKGTFGMQFTNASGGNIVQYTQNGAVNATTNYLRFTNFNGSGGTPVISTQGGNADIDLTLTPKGTGTVRTSGTGVQLVGSTSGYVGLKGAAAAGSTTYQLPAADGTNGQVLATNGSAVLTWATASGGGALAKQTDVFTTGTAATYTAPANTQWVKITVVGIGGLGGQSSGQRAQGGSAGGVAIKWLAITAGQTLTYTVSSTIGTASTVSSGTLTISTITANSGTSGAFSAYAASSTATVAGGTATGGDINITGGEGGRAYGTSTAVGTQVCGKGGDCPGWGTGGVGAAITTGDGGSARGYGAGAGGTLNTSTGGTNGPSVIIFEAY
jgi:hypothetical protein